MKEKLWRRDFVHDATNKLLSRNVNYIVDVVIWPKFRNSSKL